MFLKFQIGKEDMITNNKALTLLRQYKVSKWGIEQLGPFFGSIFLYFFSCEVAAGDTLKIKMWLRDNPQPLALSDTFQKITPCADLLNFNAIS